MADPLQSAAESLAPSRSNTNFFGSSQSQDVLSRYAVAGRNVAEQEKTAEAASRLASSRFARAEERRREVTWGREDEEYNLKKDFESTRAKVIVGISDTLRDSVGTGDFLDRVAGLKANLPTEARDDDAVKSLITMYSREHDFLNMERKQNEQINQRLSLGARASVLTPEERNGIPKDLDGNIDPQALNDAIVGAETRDKLLKDQETTAKATEKAKAAELKAAKKAEIESAVKDLGAFPSEVAMEMRKSGDTNEEAFKRRDLDAYNLAKAFDDNRLQREYDAAVRIGNVDSYILAGEKNPKNPKMTDEQKARRRLIFEEAMRLKSLKGDNAPAAAEVAPAPVAEVAPAASAAPAASDRADATLDRLRQ